MTKFISSFVFFTLIAEHVGAVVEHCRCEVNGEDLYSRRHPTHVLESELGFHSVKIDRNGYYIADGYRILPRFECDHHRRLHHMHQEEESVEARGFFSYWVSQWSVRGANNKDFPLVFSCDLFTVSTPPHGSGMPPTEEAFLLAELRKSKYVLDGDGSIFTSKTPFEFTMNTRPDGTHYLIESELDCEKLPLSVRLNRNALPYHCRCPENVNPTGLSDECHDKSVAA